MGARIIVSVLAAVSAPAQALDAPPSLESYSFTDYEREYNKTYAGEDRVMRQAFFHRRLLEAKEHNDAYLQGRSTYFLGMDQFSDRTDQELGAMHAPIPRYAGPGRRLGPAVPRPLNLPESEDWAAKNVVQEVRDQGGCGSCWAFAATDSVEMHYAIATGTRLRLSAQATTDCAPNPDECGGTGACGGSTIMLGYEYFMTAGLPTEAEYPYKGRSSPCRPHSARVIISHFIWLPEHDPYALQEALANVGPVGVHVYSAWGSYRGGIFTGCSFNQQGERRENVPVNHAVVAVGYTPTYWRIQNSYGRHWGDEGYISLSRATDRMRFQNKRPADGTACKPYPEVLTVAGECGVLSDMTYPVGVRSGR